MKRIITATALLLALASCKKDRQPSSPIQPLKKVTSIERAADGANKSVYTYDQQGRISVVDFGNNYSRTEYDYNTPGLAFKQYNNNGQLSWEVSNGVIENGRLVSATFKSYVNGQLHSERTGTYTYNAAGYLVKMDYPSYYMVLEYTNGNCTKTLYYRKDTGVLDETTTMEYHTNLPNKFNLSFFEYSNYLPLFHNMGTMGKANANLVKRVTIQNANHTRITDYDYILDAKGYATGYSFSSVQDGGAPYSERYTVNY
jgi:hypothetical protein